MRMSRGLLGLVGLPLLLPACAARGAADPREAARAYGEAAARGNAGALYAMMSTSSRRDHGPDEVARVVSDERTELAEQGAALEQPGARVAATARLRYADGEEAALDLRDGRYWVTSAGALPGGGRTPEEAIAQLRRVLARRSYAGLIRVLSPA
jgi:TPR repeat protein